MGVIQDGAPELWTLLTTALAAAPLVTTYSEAIDRSHLNERLAEVLRSVEPDVAARGDRLAQWNERLDRDDNAIYRIRAAVRDRHADAITRKDRTLLDTLGPHLTYLENNGHLMRYSRLRTVGLRGEWRHRGRVSVRDRDQDERERSALAAPRNRGRPDATRCA